MQMLECRQALDGCVCMLVLMTEYSNRTQVLFGSMYLPLIVLMSMLTPDCEQVLLSSRLLLFCCAHRVVHIEKSDHNWPIQEGHGKVR
jgi:hypothetical protein